MQHIGLSVVEIPDDRPALMRVGVPVDARVRHTFSADHMLDVVQCGDGVEKSSRSMDRKYHQNSIATLLSCCRSMSSIDSNAEKSISKAGAGTSRSQCDGFASKTFGGLIIPFRFKACTVTPWRQ
ncbi:uncharacterized protein BCR38DRAFT_226519 [Pseudomassariella vexata]|uniref:Uncharacterized protein n=1 Tax=Pseudomassariella vexata TaxID=1141098 RepID=A0A1Y2DVJ4_9PEZI|nr:uncharacterized protein BCR38DRAFT_226519 [Pseudomassariella vexata]ORY63310.1 hypothetical protein BCR38DRAFT_226519 [Pseudomassariella vexata]